jgi:hypothetical protein
MKTVEQAVLGIVMRTAAIAIERRVMRVRPRIT